jgi:hypothetical protein
MAGDSSPIPVQFNPTELQLEKQSQYAEIGIPGLIAPLQQFVRGQAEVLTLELFFDTSDKGTGVNAESVAKLTDEFYALARIEPTGHAPPPVTFHWGSEFPGHNLPSKQGGQQRDAFTGVVVSLRQTFTMWSRSGLPIRAKLNLTIREYLPLEEQLTRLNPSSPDRTHGHVLREGETLSQLAHTYWLRAGDWRRIATDNGVEDPRRLTPGRNLRVPRIPASGVNP